MVLAPPHSHTPFPRLFRRLRLRVGVFRRKLAVDGPPGEGAQSKLYAREGPEMPPSLDAGGSHAVCQLRQAL